MVAAWLVSNPAWFGFGSLSRHSWVISSVKSQMNPPVGRIRFG